MDRDHSSLVPWILAAALPMTWAIAGGFVGRLSGWYALTAAYPDRPEAPLLTLGFQTGYLNGVRMNNVLRLSVCPSGLRVGLWRLFGPFCRDFLVPWPSLSVRPDCDMQGYTALRFGRAELRLASASINRLAAVARRHWPGQTSIAVE